jgi:hypothetical protein
MCTGEELSQNLNIKTEPREKMKISEEHNTRRIDNSLGAGDDSLITTPPYANPSPLDRA